MKNSSIILLLFVALVSCQSEANQSGCVSKNLSTQQKKENNLFLSFYYGMTLSEFKVEEQKLINAHSLFRSDTVSKFVLATNYGSPAKSVFVLTPQFDQCFLYSIELECLPVPDYFATFKSYNSAGYETREIPDEFNIIDIERLYKEKYGKPKTFVNNSSRGSKRSEWIIGNKKINLLRVYDAASGGGKEEFRKFSGFRMEYRSTLFDKILKSREDSVKVNLNKKVQQQAEDGKNAI